MDIPSLPHRWGPRGPRKNGTTIELPPGVPPGDRGDLHPSRAPCLDGQTRAGTGFGSSNDMNGILFACTPCSDTNRPPVECRWRSTALLPCFGDGPVPYFRLTDFASWTLRTNTHGVQDQSGVLISTLLVRIRLTGAV